MGDEKYEYEVAISFVAEDEPLATRIADLISDRMTVFLYSRHQEVLAGTDGEKTFNRVFGEQSRLVVVLYREKWGTTSWTRIEEVAIRNRAFKQGYDFVILVPLEEPASVPKWLPRTQLWVGLSRWGTAGAASVIEARVQELGGAPAPESVTSRAARAEREIQFAATRKNYLESCPGVQGALAEFTVLRDEICRLVENLKEQAPSLGVSVKTADRAVAVLSSGPALSVDWYCHYSNTLSDSGLTVGVWAGHPPFPGVRFYENPKSYATEKFCHDLLPDGKPGWVGKINNAPAQVSSKVMAEHIVKWWLDKAMHYRNKQPF